MEPDADARQRASREEEVQSAEQRRGEGPRGGRSSSTVECEQRLRVGRRDEVDADTRAEECEVPAERVLTTWTADELLAWTREK